MFVVVVFFVVTLFVGRDPVYHGFVCPSHFSFLSLGVGGPDWAGHYIIMNCFF